MWFQNRRAKWRKQEHTKKGPGRPAHNSQPLTCSGEPISEEEIKRKEQERLEKKRRKQKERLRRLGEKQKLFSTVNNMQTSSPSSVSNFDRTVKEMEGNDTDETFDNHHEMTEIDTSIHSTNRTVTNVSCSEGELQISDSITQAKQNDHARDKKRKRNPFSIDSLLDKNENNETSIADQSSATNETTTAVEENSYANTK